MSQGQYHGFRTDKGCTVLDRKGRLLPARQDVLNHTSEGFEWGFVGSGPAQLALAILCDLVGASRAVPLHRAFERKVIAKIKDATWALSETQIGQAITEIENEGEIVSGTDDVYDDLPF